MYYNVTLPPHWYPVKSSVLQPFAAKLFKDFLIFTFQNLNSQSQVLSFATITAYEECQDRVFVSI
jgi:hypothetical protein